MRNQLPGTESKQSLLEEETDEDLWKSFEQLI